MIRRASLHQHGIERGGGDLTVEGAGLDGVAVTAVDRDDVPVRGDGQAERLVEGASLADGDARAEVRAVPEERVRDAVMRLSSVEATYSTSPCKPRPSPVGPTTRAPGRCAREVRWRSRSRSQLEALDWSDQGRRGQRSPS